MKANFDGVAGLSCQLRFAVAFIVLATATGMPGRLFAQSWAGPYLGVHAGQNRLSTDTHLSNVTPTSNLFLNQALNLGLMPTQFSGEHSSFAYGVSAGYNWQFGRFIAGVEADITRSQSRVNHDFKLGDAGFVFFGGPAHMDASMDWLATFRGRAGFLVSDRFLLFGTGGLALAHVNASSRITQPSTLPDCSVATACGNGASSGHQLGWVVGGGGEFSLHRNWNLKIEYLYYDLGGASYIINEISTAAANQPSLRNDFRLTGQQMRAGINYRF
jgi:outer membrane immunogenic protein